MNQVMLEADYSAAGSADELFGTLSVAEIKALYSQNPTFRAKADEFNGQPTTTLAPSQDEIDAAKAAEPVVVPEILVETPVVVQQPEVVPSVVQVPEPVEELYDGIEKIGEGSYKLTVDPEDGSPAEIFYGATQKDCFKALRRSKAHATKELRRRAKKIQITKELEDLKVEKIDYAPFLTPLSLTADEVYTLTEQMKDPTTVLEASRKLRLASLTPEECARQNEIITRQRRNEQASIAATWLISTPEFYNCDENIEKIRELMGTLDWAVTPRNLDLAFKTLTEQGALLERPEEHVPKPVAVQPASVVPVIAAPVVVTPVATPVAVVAPPQSTNAAQAATAGALPDAAKVLRPGSSSTATMPTRRIDSVQAPQVPVLTVEEYNNTSAAVVKMRYQREPAYKAQVDALIASGKI